jgi:hypothetical protein
MYQKDYIMRVVEEMAKVLAAVFGLRDQKDYGQAQAQIEKAYEDLLKVEPDAIKDIPEEDIITELENEYDFTVQHFGMVAELMKAEADLLMDQGKQLSATKLYKKALALFEHVDATLKNYSFDRLRNISDIKNVLNN